MRDREDVRSVGVWLLIGADALFVLSFVYICAYDIRNRAPSWPDWDATASALLPSLAVGATAAAAALHRFLGVKAALLGIVAGLGCLAVFAQGTWAAGITTKAGAYGAIVWVAVGLMAAHLAGALVAGVLAALRGTDAPFLGRFLVLWSVLSSAIVGVAFWV